MDGSYQNPYHRANSPMSPETPTSAPYRANVNRTKTRKWVEAKTQNYDGDDWGADDFDEQPEPVPVPPLRPIGSRQTSLSSQTWNQPPPMPQVGHRYASGPQPSLHIQTQPVQVPSQLSQSQAEQQQPRETTAAPEIKSPAGPEPSPSVYSQGTGPVVSPQSAGSGAITAPVTVPEPSGFPPRKSSISQGEPQAAQQQTILPSSVFRRSEEDTIAANPQSSHAAGKDVEESVASQPGRSIAHNEGTTPVHTSLGSSTSPAGTSQDTVQGGRSDDGLDRTPSPSKLDQGQTQQASVLGSAPAPVEQPQPTERFSTAVIAEPQAILPSRQYEASSPTSTVEQASRNAARAQEEPRRFSTSPQLPDLARMSMFGDDFFAKPPLTSNAPPVPTLPEESEPSPQLPLASQTLPAMDRSTTPPRTDTTTILSTDQTESPTQPTQDTSPKPGGVTAEAAPTSNVTESPTGEIESREPSRPERAQQKRPSFPGGWVTETATPSAETEPAVNPIESAPTERSNMPAVSDDGGGSPAAFEPVPLKWLRSTSGPGSVTASDDHVQRTASPIASLSLSPAPEGWSPTLAALQTRPVDDPPEKFAAPERQSTLSTINSPSPIKESDKLREEIIRTLSPVRPTHDHDATGDSKGGLSVLPSQAGRESTYLHGVYDDYWSGPEDRPPHSKQDDADPAPAPAIPATDGTMLSSPRDVSEVPPLSPRSPRREPVHVPAALPEVNLLPRRFSWEAGNEDQPQSAEQGSAVASAPQFAVDVSSGPSSQHSQLLAPSIGNPEEPTNDDDKPPSSAADELPSRLADKSQVGILDNTALVSHQVSQVSTLPLEKQDSAGPEPPSPISAASDKPPPFKGEPEPKTRRLSLADEKRLQVSTSDQTSPLPSPGGHPALAERTVAVGPEAEGSPTQHHVPAQSTQSAQKLLSFREILDLPSPADRIAKYNETRAQFASTDSGLNNWIVSLQSQHAEHGAASSSYHTSITAARPGSASAQRSPTNAPSASQQPYYQQYLNASSPNATPGAPGRPSTSNMGTGASHSPSSDFKHSSGQVGAKGKELLLGAAKAGKGLLSKGKNKLRGGDKNEESSSSSSPPPPQAKARNDRRASWGLSLGPRSSGLKGDADPQSNSPQPRRLSTVSSSAPKIPQPLRLSPLDTFPNSTGVLWATSQPRPRTPPDGVNAQGDSQPELVSPVSDTHSLRKAQHDDNTNDEYDAADSVQIPQPISKTQPSWDPTNATPLFEENDFDLDHSQPSIIPNGRSVAPADDRDDDWVVVEPQAPGEPYRMMPSGASKKPTSGPTTTQRATSSEVPRNNATHTQQAPPETSPQRNSSFVGLPPIRRSSTFGINYARRAKERFSLDEDEMDNFSRTSTLDANAGPSTLSSQQQQQQQHNSAVAQQNGDLPTGTGTQTRDSQQGLAGDTLGASSLGRPASYASSEVDVGDDPEKPPVAEPAPYQNRRAAPMQHQNMRPQPGVLGQNIPGGNPVQHLPPQGPWKLEESHLSEPLLPASRSRHAPDTSQAYFGFDKETGATNPVPIQQRSAVQMPPRQKFSETPPSSARRYPELFSRAVGQQQPPPQQQLQQQQAQQQQQQQQQSQKHLDQAMSRTSQDLPPQVYQQQPPSREDVILQHSNTSEFQVPGVGPPPEDHRGRERRGSGIFKEIGGRFRTASRERKGSVIESSGLEQQPGVDVRGDEVSESSFDTQELRDRKKKRRSSFFMSLRGSKPASSGGPPGASGDDTADSSDVAEQPQTHAQLQQQFAHQRKRSFFGSTPGSGLGPPTLSRTSTSSNVHETEGSMHSHQSPKKRLSTLTGKFFHRSSGQVEEPPKPMTAQSIAPSLQSRLSGLPNSQPGVPSPLADHRRERSDTTTSRPATDHEPQYQNQGDAHDVKHGDRGRRASAGNFLAGLLGNRSSSKPRGAHPQPERLSQDQPQQFQFQRQPQPQAGQVGHQPSPQPAFQPGMGDAQHVNRLSPPPFRTQGPPVHPIADVASPEQRGQSSFPGPQKAPDNTRVSVQQVNSDTDEAGSDTEQSNVTTAATLQAKPNGDLPQSQVHTRPVPDVNSRPLGLPTATGTINKVSPNVSPDFSSVNHQTHREFGAGTERMPFSPDHVQHVQRIETQQIPRGQPGASPETLGQLPAQSIQQQSSGADLLPPREQFSSSPRLNDGYQPPPSETSLQDGRVSHLSMGSFQEPSTHSSPNLSSQVDPRVQRPVSISPVPEGLHQPPGASIHARASAPLLTTQTTGHHGVHHGYGPSQASRQSFGPGVAFSNSEEPHESRRSRWLMGKSSQQPMQASQPKLEKERSAKSIFNAFKRSSKLPPANQAQPDLAAYRTNSHQQHQQTMQGRPLNPQQGPQQSFSQRQHQEAQAHGQPQQLLHGPANHLAQGQAPPLSHPQPINGHVQMGPHHLYQQQRMSPATVPVPGQIDPRHNSFNSPHQPHGRSPELDQRGARSPPQPAHFGGYDTSATHGEHDRMGQGLGGPRSMQNASADLYSAPIHQLAQSQQQQQQQQQQQRSLIEPQYDQVPIPRGYEAVHGEGSVEPSPYLYGRRVSGGFQRPSLEQQPSNNTGNRRQFSAEQPYRPYSQTQQVQPALRHGVSPPLGQQASLRDSIALGSSSQTLSHAGHPATHSGPPVGLGLDRQQAGYGGQNMQYDGRNNQRREGNQLAQQQRQPYVRHDEAAKPPHFTNLPGQGIAANSVAIDTGMSSMARNEKQPPRQIQASQHVAASAPRATSNMSNSNPSTPAGRNLNINVQSANHGDHDDIYDSTPRRPMEPLKPTITGDSQVSAGSNEEQQALQARREAEAAGASADQAKTTLARDKSTRAELEDTEDERKRSIRLEEQEEKILYDPDEDYALVTDRDAARKDPDAPLMSATSYPGMEWNPYMAGGYDDLDEPAHK